jgi:hypothetical protein
MWWIRWLNCFSRLLNKDKQERVKPAGPTRQAFFWYYMQIYNSFAGQKQTWQL